MLLSHDNSLELRWLNTGLFYVSAILFNSSPYFLIKPKKGCYNFRDGNM